MNQLNPRHGDETTDPPQEWNSQHIEDHFKYRTSPPKTSPMVLDIVGRMNHHAIDNGDVEVNPSEFLFESNSESDLRSIHHSGEINQ